MSGRLSKRGTHGRAHAPATEIHRIFRSALLGLALGGFVSATSAFRRCRRPTGRGHGTGEGTSSRGNPSPSSAPVGARSTASRTKRTPRILRDTISSRSHSPLRKGVGSVAGVATDRTLTGDGAAGTVHASLEARTPLAYGFSKTSRLARSGAVRFRPPRPGRSTGKLPFENRTSSKTAAAVSSAGTSVMPPHPFRKGAMGRSKFFRTNRAAPESRCGRW